LKRNSLDGLYPQNSDQDRVIYIFIKYDLLADKQAYNCKKWHQVFPFLTSFVFVDYMKLSLCKSDHNRAHFCIFAINLSPNKSKLVIRFFLDKLIKHAHNPIKEKFI